MTREICLDKNWLNEYSHKVRSALKSLAGRDRELYVTGGAVRDWLTGKMAADLDLTVAGDGVSAARFLAVETGGTFVLLDEQQGVARVVTEGLTLDISSFREGTVNIHDDLARRDFSINAMAVAVDQATGTLLVPYTLIDPLGGAADLGHRSVRAPGAEVFINDPLRLLRAYRFSACLSFTVEEQTERWIKEKSSLLAGPASERIRYELDRIMASDRAAETFVQMNKVGLLGELFPELISGEGLKQPASHHLDVFNHNMAALAAVERIIATPASHFPKHLADFQNYLAVAEHPRLLKWVALFHDLGKPDTCATRQDGRTTFYNHDQAGARIFVTIARRFRWSREHLATVAKLIELHMYPFHLSNAVKNTGITPRACLRLIKAAGDDLPGLFLIAMADSLASQGVLRPPAMERSLVELYDLVDNVYRESIRPVLTGPPLLSGQDLKEMGLVPGPVFGQIMDGIEQARVAGEIGDRAEAVAWVESFMAAESARAVNPGS